MDTETDSTTEPLATSGYHAGRYSESDWKWINELATTPFEVWTDEPGSWTPPTNEEWAKLANPLCVTLRIAYTIMKMDRARLMEFTGDLDEELSKDIQYKLDYAKSFFEMMAAVIRGADARMFVGLACVEVDAAATWETMQ